MGGFLVLLLQSLVQTTEADSTPTTTGHTDNHDLPSYVFGADGEFLGRVDTPTYAGAERGQ